jgi:dihydroflavonol-4-reductase
MAGEKESVLVTGGSGFVGSHCIIQCLNANYRVRTTVRSLKREQDVRDMVTAGGIANLNDLSVFEADLAKDAGWADAIKGCTYVLHVASPLPLGVPKNEDEVIVPAREGTLRVLRAAKAAGVKRVVMTSSMSAIAAGHTGRDASKPFTEADWSVVDGPGLQAYEKSKTLAEKDAWDFVEKEGGLELSVINPGFVLGPVLTHDISPSIELPLRLLAGQLPACPRLNYYVIDVRDLADLHLRAMTDPKANGERFICVADQPLWVKDVSKILRERLGKAARRCPTRELPNFVLKIMSWFDPALGLVTPNLGLVLLVSNGKAKEVLGWEPRSAADATVASGESLIKVGLVKS